MELFTQEEEKEKKKIKPELQTKFNDESNLNTALFEKYNKNEDEIEIDDVKLETITDTFIFNTEGEHFIKYKMKNQEEICDYLFLDCDAITEIYYSDTVNSIGVSAFKNCINLKRLNSNVDGIFNLPHNLITINKESFYNCQLLESIKIPDTVTTIGEYAFCSCISLSFVKLSNNLTCLSNNIF